MLGPRALSARFAQGTIEGHRRRWSRPRGAAGPCPQSCRGHQERASPVPLPGGCSGAWTRARVELLENPVHELTGELLEELGSAGLLELAKHGLVDSSRAPRLTLAEVIDERLARDPGQVGHGHGLNGPAGREAHERSLEHP